MPQKKLRLFMLLTSLILCLTAILPITAVHADESFKVNAKAAFLLMQRVVRSFMIKMEKNQWELLQSPK